jgi:hypothetical protein
VTIALTRIDDNLLDGSRRYRPLSGLLPWFVFGGLAGLAFCDRVVGVGHAQSTGSTSADAALTAIVLPRATVTVASKAETRCGVQRRRYRTGRNLQPCSSKAR